MKHTKDKIISMKFGGTSVITAEKRELIVQHVKREIAAGKKPALVISAMGRRGDPYATDTILDLIRNLGGTVEPRNYSFLFVTGEMISVAVMTHTLSRAGIQSLSLTGGQAGVVTDDFHMSAGIKHLNHKILRKAVADGHVPVVCGGQGMTETNQDFSILGRGGSDTSGVLVGMMLNAERADIYTDVEFVLAVDPRVVKNDFKREVISYEAALAMARFGAKVIHPGAVRLAQENDLPLRVRSTFSQSEGTLIGDQSDPKALVGIPSMDDVKIAELKDFSFATDVLATLEQRIGLLSFKDQASGRVILCTPSGDTVSEVDHEIGKYFSGQIDWQTGFSLVSLIGRPDSQAEIDSKSIKVLSDKNIQYRYRDLHDRRSTFVIEDRDSKKVVEALFNALFSYL